MYCAKRINEDRSGWMIALNRDPAGKHANRIRIFEWRERQTICYRVAEDDRNVTIEPRLWRQAFVVGGRCMMLGRVFFDFDWEWKLKKERGGKIER